MQMDPQVQTEQLKHSMDLANGEAELWGARVMAAQRRAKAERKLLLAAAVHIFGGSLDPEKKKLVDNYMRAHKDEQDAIDNYDGLQLSKLQSQAAIYAAMHAEMIAREGRAITGAPAKRVVLSR